ncbi:MAG: bifunctional adenosylcobinamide kinase/adenosylcobinamide-phosphate guanylyltransferase [Nitrospirae bacterium]|nr:bifunctional adenosylcobinamide kinase/adenosylcobinamide-phosphate guanylyltransferase [Nitrospirota bacterium]
MKKIVLVTGGARSGKSSFALDSASKSTGRKYFIATAEGYDEEMKQRIENHKKERSHHWITIEEPVDIGKALAEIDRPDTVAVLDCLTLWVSNLMREDTETSSLERSFKEFLQVLRQLKSLNIYIVTNEVGMGIVPENPLARIYRDMLGRLNQAVAELSDEVYLMISGIALKVK